eukprot:UN05622
MLLGGAIIQELLGLRVRAPLIQQTVMQVGLVINLPEHELLWTLHQQRLQMLSHRMSNGVCVDADENSPPNYSNGGQTDEECRDECISYNAPELYCIGYSYYSQINRCALWMDAAHDDIPDKADWNKFPMNGT